MLEARWDLELRRMLRKRENSELPLIGDMDYFPQGTQESGNLFTLIAERHERRSLGITSNPVFSQGGGPSPFPLDMAVGIVDAGQTALDVAGQ